jgi:hypothetical protein
MLRKASTEGRTVPWFKCSHCRIRRSGLDVAMSAMQDRCPLCGRTLDPERDLTSLMGFSFLASDHGSPRTRDAWLPETGRTSDADLDAISDGLAAERWLDEGGSGEPRR